MKSLVRFGRQMLFAGAAIAGTTIGLSLPAAALPEEMILQKLEAVPMYMLITDDGQPIFASVQDGENGESTGITGVFVSPSDAENLVIARREEAKQLLAEEQAKPQQDVALIAALEDQSALWEEANILPIGLDRIYEFAQSEDADNLSFQFFPTLKQVQNASEVLEDGQTFPGVPLFFLSAQATDEQGQPITTFPTTPILNPALTPKTIANCDQNAQTPEVGDDCTIPQIPLFFEVEPILTQLEGLDNTDNLSINVMPLEVFISKLVNEDLPNDEKDFLQNMSLIPAAESTQLIQSILESGEAPQ
ncbi:hypothetical protein Lepto7376_2869 [[Leptolyngbya] sp. PCC 7376]|uniref:Tic22 family protein n=1 Tax=[Leptolyngbya] sp. PCC 7376 TaxID=111781 RepID=UPI00029F4693|nr:Tic22 family protein [[Leptolyngbya] sp. PCC 7376]AFY39121.1 hypothetical protein Lepto7376_2869 [[Leptolyngbya] sp. PCC 7376]